MDKVLFSIIIPVFKIEDYIEQCVESTIRQKMSNYEVILVDDGSPDRCPEICDELQEKYNCVHVIHKENGGVSAARRDGIRVAKGEYIVCVDGDDWIAENCLSVLADDIKKTNADIVCYGTFHDNGRDYIPFELKYRSGYYSKSDIEKEIFPILIQNERAEYFSPSVWGKAIRRELIGKYMLVDRLATIGEDGACVIPCVYHANSLYIEKQCFYYYRYNDRSATKGKKPFNWDWPRITAEHIENNIDIMHSDFREQLDRKITHDVFNVTKSQFYQRKQYYIITKEIKKHLKEEPYQSAIERCIFSGTIMGKVMRLCLKNKILLPIYLYSRVRF
ncbi:MAG: glycosyltransferase [Clostridiales bacterium]|nr:glycosyltransferase [Clostridiales bacterium]